MELEQGHCVLCGVSFEGAPLFRRTKHEVECAALDSELGDLIANVASVTGAPRGHVVLVLLQKRWQTGKADDSILMQQCMDVLLDGGLSPAAVAFWLAKGDDRVEKLQRDCTVCLDTFGVEKMFTLDCTAAHRFCFDCIRESVERELGLKLAPKCPAKDCAHIISETEIVQLFTREGAAATRWESVMRDNAISQMGVGVVRCPSRDCQNAMALVDPTGQTRERCDCDVCGATFCSMCRLAYHYRTTCADARIHAQIWLEWNGRNRQLYHESQEQLRAAYREAQHRLEQRHREQMTRHTEESNDENWKQQHGKMCPSCGRVIVRESGCDLMVCGRDTHGGNQQNGCGHRFNWTAAQPYRAAIRPLDLEAIQFVVPEQSTKRHHELCDNCGNQIIGIRFECSQCPCTNFCQQCEFRVDHPQDHVMVIRRE